MKVHEWLLPVGVGAAAAVATWLVVDFTPQADPEPVEDAPPWDGTLWPFLDGPVGNGTLLVMDPQERLLGRIAGPEGVDAVPAWKTPAMGVVPSVPSGCTSLTCPEAPWLERPVPDGADRLSLDASVRISAYAFLANGTLLASTAPDLETARFTRSGDFIRIPDAVWYLGDGEAPEGTQVMSPVVHAVLAPILAGAAGMPEGGILTVVLEEHPYAWLTGTLYVTVRLDEVMGLGESAGGQSSG